MLGRLVLGRVRLVLGMLKLGLKLGIGMVRLVLKRLKLKLKLGMGRLMRTVKVRDWKVIYLVFTYLWYKK